MSGSSPYVSPRKVTSVADCIFYHTMEIPGHGLVEGLWDLREGPDEYLGGVDVRGKRVLDIGTASGFLSFYMERKGAEVVSYDLSEEHEWDLVPYALLDQGRFQSDRKAGIRMMNDGYWLAHAAFDSSARVVTGTLHSLPHGMGFFDIAVFGSVLVHVRDPFLAMAEVLPLTRETVIVTDILPTWLQRVAMPWRPALIRRAIPIWHLVPRLLIKLSRREISFLPNFRRREPAYAWWILSPKLIRKFMGVLGFERAETKFHFQRMNGRRKLLYTVVGHRTAPMRAADLG
jgi:SAM-dependent methyltransferase